MSEPFASATVEIWKAAGKELDRLEASAAFHWDVSKDWGVFVTEVTEIADKMLANFDHGGLGYTIIKFTTKQCKIQFKQRTEA
jgi:hypothetical protein